MLLASAGRKVLFHSVPNYELCCTYGDYEQPIRCLKFSRDSKYMLIVPENNKTEIIRSGSADETKCLQLIKIKSISCATFYNKTHRYIALGCKTGHVSVWDSKAQITYKRLPLAESCVKCLDVSPTDNHILVGCDTGAIILYGLMSNSRLEEVSLPHRRSMPTSIHFSPRNRSLVAVTDEAGYLSVWDIVKRKPTITTCNHHTSICSDMVFSPANSNFIASVGHDFMIHMYDIRRYNPICSHTTDFKLTSVSMSPDGFSLTCGHHQGGVLVYDLRKCTDPLFEFCSQTGDVTHVSFNSIFNVTTELKNKTNLYNDKSSNSNSRLLDLLRVSSTPRIPQTDLHKNISLVSISIKSDTSNYCNINKPIEILHELNIERPLSAQSTAYSFEFSSKDSILSSILSRDSASLAQTESSRKLSELHDHVNNLESTFENSMKRYSQEIMHMMKTKFLEMQVVLCKQHLDLGDKISKHFLQAHDSVSESQKVILKITSENVKLKHEISTLKAERQKFVSSAILNSHTKSCKKQDDVKISKSASLS